MKKFFFTIIVCFISLSYLEGQEQKLSFIKCEELRDSVLCYIQSYQKDNQGLSALWLNFDFNKFIDGDIDISVANRLKFSRQHEKQFLYKTDSLVLLVTCWPDSADYHSIIDTTRLSFYNHEECPFSFFNHELGSRHWIMKKSQLFWAYDDASQKTYNKILQGKKAANYYRQDTSREEQHVILFSYNSFIIASNTCYEHCVGTWYEKNGMIYLFNHKALHRSGQFLYDFLPDDFTLSIPSIFEFKDNCLIDKTIYFIPIAMDRPASFDEVYVTDNSGSRTDG